MKKTVFVCTLLLFLFCANAQQKTLVTDKEHLFTKDEFGRIDTLLQGYQKRSGNLVVVCTDTLDIRTKAYKDSLIGLYTGDRLIKPYALFLLLSRKNSAIQLESNELDKDSFGKKETIELTKTKGVNEPSYVTEHTKERLQQLMKILSYGLPSLKEKKLEEGVTIICQKSMEFLDALPKKELNQ